MTEIETRRLLVGLATSLFARGYSVGSAGNISVRMADFFLITPTNSCLGRLDPTRLSKLDADFRHVSGDSPSKEVFMHRAFYMARHDAGAAVHLHSTMATAVTCLPDVDAINPNSAADAVFRDACRATPADRAVLSAGQSADGGGDPQRRPRCPRDAVGE